MAMQQPSLKDKDMSGVAKLGLQKTVKEDYLQFLILLIYPLYILWILQP